MQTMLGRSRKMLLEKGVFFPVAEREEDMLAGKISPGNGGQLCRCLVKADASGTGIFFIEQVNKAKQSSCHSVLISNEKLIRALSHPGALEMMVNSALAAGFTSIKVLAIFREPVDHALSLYQHRAKEGLHGDFSVWLNEDYETIRMLKNFLPQVQALKQPIEWNFRKYASSPRVMIDMLFTDWLKIDAPDEKSLPSVNPSLSLSEIQFLQLLRVQHPLLLKPAKAAFDKLAKQQKADDQLIRGQLRYKAFLFIDERKEVFEELNGWMPVGEKLHLSPEPEPLVFQAACFSSEQLCAIISATQIASNQSFRLKERIANGIKAAKRNLFAKQKIRDMYNLEP